MPIRIATTTDIPYTELEVADGNFDTSRAAIDRVVIHTMVGTWQGAAARFDNPTSKVSAHYGVKLDGGLIHWLEECNTAYHAGDYPMNQRSIGIEHEDGGDYNGVRPDALYTTSAKLVRDICQFYNIPIDRNHIKKHSEVSDNPTGCPDALDIDRIVREANNPATSGTDLATLQAKLDQKNKDYDALYNQDQNNLHTISQQKDTLSSLNALLDARNNNITQLSDDKKTLQFQIDNLTFQLQTAQEQANKVPALQTKFDQADNDRTICLQRSETQNKKIAALEAGKPKGVIKKLIFLFT